MKYKAIFIVSLLLAVCFFPSKLIAVEKLDTKLVSQFTQFDDLLFKNVFNQCELAHLNDLIDTDFEFYHDVAGFQDRAEFIQAVEKNICSNLKHKPIRKLVSGSMLLFPMYNEGKLYAMIQSGVHEFFIREQGKPVYKTGIAKFTHLWVLSDNAWKLKRVLSFDHKPASD
ncbi:hypothetical protein [Aliikangiella sp. IMCC44632]